MSQTSKYKGDHITLWYTNVPILIMSPGHTPALHDLNGAVDVAADIIPKIKASPDLLSASKTLFTVTYSKPAK